MVENLHYFSPSRLIPLVILYLLYINCANIEEKKHSEH